MVLHVFCLVLLFFRAAASTTGKLHLVNQSRYPLAAALDGSPPAYYFRAATAAGSAKKWLLFFEGGDFCGYGTTFQEQLEDCYKRSQSDLGSSRSYLKSPLVNLSADSSLFDDVATRNPVLHDWNWVEILYLDGGYYAGANMTTPVVNGTALHFRGAFNVEAIMGDLADLFGFSAAGEVVISGCSSGGVAILAGADRIRTAVRRVAPHAHVYGFADSGYYLDVNTDYWTQPVFAMMNLSGTLSSRCVSGSHRPWSCIVAGVVAPFIMSVPIFVWQSRYDANQLDCVNIAQSNISGVNAYGAQLLSSIRAWVSGAHSSGVPHGAFVDACLRHCGSQAGIVADDLSPNQAFAKWYGHPHMLDGPIVQAGTYPCGNCCSSVVLLSSRNVFVEALV